MKTFKVEANINGSMIFANSKLLVMFNKNQAEAQRQVDDLLADTSVKEAISKYKDSLTFETTIKEQKERER